MTVSDAERTFYLQVLNDPTKSKYSIDDLRYAYYLAGLSGALPGSGGGAANGAVRPTHIYAPVGSYQQTIPGGDAAATGSPPQDSS